MNGWPCCPHCQFCTEDEPLHGEPCDEPGCNDGAYLTPDEFAALPSDAHHAVWKAAKRIDTIPVSKTSGIRRYHREQVEALLAELEAEG